MIRLGGAVTVLVGSLCLLGCATNPRLASDDIGHVYNMAHPWHAVPAYYGFGVVGLAWGLVVLPFGLVVPDGFNFHTSPLTPIWLWPSYGFGTVVGGVSYVVGYPLELLFPGTDDAPPPPPVPPELPAQDNPELAR